MLALPRPVVNRILGHAQEGGVAGATGLIAARDGRAASLYPLPEEGSAGPEGGPAGSSVASGAAAGGAAGLAARLDAVHARMAARGEQVLALYHAHPRGPAEPERDHVPEPVRALLGDGAYWLVVTLGTKGVLEMRAFRDRGARFEEVPVGLED
jgi:proteasome lid subunit RPN8/RPN11